MKLVWMGTWTVHSDLDPRWNKVGRGEGAITSGGPEGIKDWIKQAGELYGEKPKDLTWSFWKD
jgi:hypothetical protein